MLFIVLCVFILCAFCLRVWQKETNAVCRSRRRLDGKTCVVTGGTAGMGLEVAKDLAKRGARVIIACPFHQEGIDAQNLIVKETRNDEVEYRYLDLSSLKSTREFAESVIKTEERLDVLVNNAGIALSFEKTADGLNKTMAVNYYGHFLLTLLLIPLLKKSGTEDCKSRIVNLSSVCHYFGTYKYGKMNDKNTIMAFFAYGNSKFCFLLFALELTKKLKGANVIINNVDPGAVGTTDIFSNSFGVTGGFIVTSVFKVFFKNPLEGAQTTIFAAVDENAGEVSGKFFKNCKEVSPKKSALDPGAAAKLFGESSKLVGLKDKTVEIIFTI